MKKVLVLYYTQTGQLFDILSNIVSDISGENVQVDYYTIEPEKPFEFPWKQKEFYNTFPDTYLQIPAAIHPPKKEILENEYDLVILGYQVWFLTPSIPINSFLKSDFAKQILASTPVVTVVACRNMWIMAQEKLKRLLKNAGANHVGHIALVDRNINHISVITIAHWMFSGRKDRYLGIFPKPGVSDADIADARRFGSPIKEALFTKNFDGLQGTLLKLGAVVVNPFLITTDIRGNAIFSKWANLISKKGERTDPQRLKWVGFFKYYLLFAIWVIGPIVFIVFLLTYLPLYRKHQSNKEYYSSVRLKEI